MDLDLWQQEVSGDQLIGHDKTKIFEILEMAKGIDYNKKISKDEDGNDVEGKKPFYQTLQKKLAFMNQKHVVKHLHVEEYPDDDDDDED